MFCNKCGKDINPNMSFCPVCGNPVQNTNNVQPIAQQDVPVQKSAPVMNGQQPPVQPMVQQGSVQSVPFQQSGPYQATPGVGSQQTNNNNKNKIIILIGSAIILLLIILIIFIVRDKDKDNSDVIASSRTVLVYLCGSDLEEKLGLASNDLAGIDPSQVDLSTTNVVVYAGGATKWHNYINANENAIYVLTENGFEKKEVYNKASMGKSGSLLNLLDYGYKNYKADKYDLVMWNHGLGALGISSDTNFNNDYLSLNEITAALENSKFGDDVKFETVIFRSCLNATVEVGTVFVPYANYLVASEEVTWGGVESNILGFINELELEHDGKTVGINFIEYYINTLKNMAQNYYNSSLDSIFPGSTYSILDLSKLSNLQKKLNLFVGDINLDVNYKEIAKVRSNMNQYGTDVVEYDTVDLYELISSLKFLSPGDATGVLDAIDEVVVYNWTNTDYSNGLAVYFPYKSGAMYRTIHKANYQNLNGLKDYYTFIYDFSNLQSKATSGGFSAISKENIDLKVTNKKATLTLNDSNVDNYAKVSYAIFEKVDDSNFNLVYESNTTGLNKNVLEVDLNVKLIKVGNDIIAVEKHDNNIYMADVNVKDGTDMIDGKLYINIDIDNNKATASKIIPNADEIDSGEKISSGYILSAKDYDSIVYLKNTYNILDSNGVDKDNWDNNSSQNKINGSNDGFVVSDVTNDYYVLFKIYDVDNLYTYSKLTKIN